MGQRFYQIDHMTFSKNVFSSVNCTLFFYQIGLNKMHQAKNYQDFLNGGAGCF